MNWRIACVLAACAAAVVAQTPPVTILQVEIDNLVCYLDDLDNPDNKATSVSVVARASTEMRYRTFKTNLCMADIVAVNGKPAKGFYAQPYNQILAATELTPGRSIGDTPARAPLLAPTPSFSRTEHSSGGSWLAGAPGSHRPVLPPAQDPTAGRLSAGLGPTWVPAAKHLRARGSHPAEGLR